MIKEVQAYTHDVLGRITDRTEMADGQLIEDSYQYDLSGRLVSATRNGQTTTWAYDANGNRTHENGQPIASHDKQDRLIAYGSAQYQYNASGDLQSKTKSGETSRYQRRAGCLLQVASMLGWISGCCEPLAWGMVLVGGQQVYRVFHPGFRPVGPSCAGWPSLSKSSFPL